MKFRSTRSEQQATLDEALVSGIAKDGGLFLPETLPSFELAQFADAGSIHDVASILLEPFFDDSVLAPELDAIIAETFSFPIPVSELPGTAGRARLLELFHGPTAAFKDVGAGFLAACMSRLQGDPDNPLTVLVATSGDTGGAVAAAFDGRAGMRVVVLYPDGRVSDRQAQQLTCWGDNVLSLAVQGSFDDCQAMAKAAMADASLAGKYRFSSANSINIGRLLPQCIYYADASLRHFRETGRKPGFVVPTGNLGNGLACCLARVCGLPISRIVLATNANRIIPDYLAGEEWLPRDSIRTLASAMDVGNPSNMERLRYLFGDADRLRETVTAISVSDTDIEAEIMRNFEEFGIATCPHTATATFAWRQLLADEDSQQTSGNGSDGNSFDWIIVATAHAAKFETIVEPLIGQEVPLPEELASILTRTRRYIEIEPDLQSMAMAMDHSFSE
ncbi:MAG: threonine synthase [Woeseiaceae bacterium]|nr:threonine synthase [Woeseiaceae bacterium]